MRQIQLRILVIIVGACLTVTSWIVNNDHPKAPRFSVAKPFNDSPQPYYFETFASSQEAPEVHAAQAHPTSSGIAAYWFGGTREGALDVKIYRANFENELWQPAQVIATRESLSIDLGRYIKKLGNPVGFRFEDGTTWVFFVSVSIGGWAGSSINLIESLDDGKTWSKARRLVTTPFFNISTLVRTHPITYQDGTIGLPVYHEFIGKFAELLRLSRSGEILSKKRLTNGTTTLQPSIVSHGPTNATALLRNAGDLPRKIIKVQTTDGGITWQAPTPLGLPNPDAAIATIAFDDQTLLAFNNSERGRSDLSLAISTPDDWRVFHRFDYANPETLSEFSYPALTIDKHGVMHLLYTWNRKLIKHVSFNSAWVNQQLK